MTVQRRLLAGLCLAALTAAGLLAQERTRASIPDAYKWDLTPIFPSDAAWRAEKDRIAAGIKAAAPFRGTLSQSATRLQEALDLQAAQDKALNRLASYAGLKGDEDTRVAVYQGMGDQVTQLGAAYGAAWAFFEPELLAMDPATVDAWIASTPGLKAYAFYLHDVLRRKAHTLNASEEALLAETGPMAAGSRNAANLLLNSDIPWPMVKLADGTQRRLDVSGFSAARASANRDDRRR